MGGHPLTVRELIAALQIMPQHAHVEFQCHDSYVDHVGEVKLAGEHVRLSGVYSIRRHAPLPDMARYKQRTERAWEDYLEAAKVPKKDSPISNGECA